MRPSRIQAAYVPLLGGSGRDVDNKIGLIHKVIQMIGTDRKIRSRRSSKKLEDIWSTNVMLETSDQVYMVISK
jgi:hypothetical protein